MVSFKHLVFILFFFSCATEVKTPQLFSLPPTKDSRPDLVEKTMFSLGLMTDYEVWEFLRNKPAESLVLENIGYLIQFGEVTMTLQNFFIIILIGFKITILSKSTPLIM